MRQRAADATMRHAERRAAGEQERESVEAETEEEEERRVLESPSPRVTTPESRASDDSVVWMMDEGALMETDAPVPVPPPALLECPVACGPP